MLTNKQSLILCGLMTGGIFVAGVLEVLTNFVVLTVLTIIFLAIIANLFFSNSKSNDEKTKDIN